MICIRILPQQVDKPKALRQDAFAARPYLLVERRPSLNNVILHHYPQSPVSEKVRVALGAKNLRWHSVIIPRLPPKPDLMPLTGGSRRSGA